MTHAFGLLVLTIASAQPTATQRAVTDVPVVEQVRRPCEATQDGPRHPVIVGRDGRFDQRCWDPKVELLKTAVELAFRKGRGTARIPFNGLR